MKAANLKSISMLTLWACYWEVICRLLGVAALLLATPAIAGEGGGAHYNPGTQGDFGIALLGPPGFYLRNDFFFFDGDIGPVTLGRFILEEARQKAWVNVVKGIYLSKYGILGSRFGGVISLPIVFDAELSGTLANPPISRSGSRGGLADMSFTGFLNWKYGFGFIPGRRNFNISAGLTVFAPTGSYSKDRIINLGRNYWSFDPVVLFTWLHPRGHEVSFYTGYMFNTENKSTDYNERPVVPYRLSSGPALLPTLRRWV